MKTTKLFVLSVALLTTLSAHAQTFTNLNFEQAHPVIVVGNPYYPFAVTAASALPAWTVTIGGAQQTTILENAPSLGSPAVGLISIADPVQNGITPIDGNYSVLLTGSSYSSTPSISQTGLIPAGTQSLLFEADTNFGFYGGSLEVLIGTQVVPFTAVATEPNYTLYGANISQWAGQTEQLTFTALQSPGLNDWLIDDISFSTNSVAAEPSIVPLTAMGGLLFAARKWFARR